MKKKPAGTTEPPQGELFSSEATGGALDLDEFLGHGKRPSYRPPAGPRKRKTLDLIEVAIDQAERRAREGDWADADGRSFVGLYGLCHRITYGVIPEDLRDRAMFSAAARLALKVLHETFRDNAPEMVEFVTWVWEREKSRESWGLRNGINRGRLGWKASFSSNFFADYRVDLARKTNKGRR